ncbi:MAG: ribose 5-phosphate isomerase B [Micavibrio aeruginosavorus]|uniref:Ribose 5-phosphate isomerase B n=1 Tax=Micavibrio aeruginosavorus TaxID=349221 RepID=A0A2W5Q198_9BACT|nr:MAG: ribose 5-phosphate isomerase B [Micavibrio aeruginosavorus]
MTIKLAIASDHAGFTLKEYLKKNFSAVKVEWVDLGPDSTDSVDYPDFGKKLADAVANGDVPLGVAICGSGIGISIACNRNPKIRAALCTDSTMARVTRLHNNANVLCLGERITGTEVALDILKAFLETDFEGGRHQRRVDKLTNC